MIFLYRLYRKLWYYEHLEEGNALDLISQRGQRSLVVITGTFVTAVLLVYLYSLRNLPPLDPPIDYLQILYGIIYKLI